MHRTGSQGTPDVLPLVWQDMMQISTWTLEFPSWMFCLTTFLSPHPRTPEHHESVGVYKHRSFDGLIPRTGCFTEGPKRHRSRPNNRQPLNNGFGWHVEKGGRHERGPDGRKEVSEVSRNVASVPDSSKSM